MAPNTRKAPCNNVTAPSDHMSGRDAVAARPRMGALLMSIWWRWGRVELPVQNLQPRTYYERVRCFVVDPGGWHRHHPSGLQSRSLAGFAPGYATMTLSASPLDDASTARGEKAASTLTLRPKPRGRESAGDCQLLRFAACLTRPDGTSARIPRGSGPVETTHPQDHGVYQRTGVRVERRSASSRELHPASSRPAALSARAAGRATVPTSAGSRGGNRGNSRSPRAAAADRRRGR